MQLDVLTRDLIVAKMREYGRAVNRGIAASRGEIIAVVQV